MPMTETTTAPATVLQRDVTTLHGLTLQEASMYLTLRQSVAFWGLIILRSASRARSLGQDIRHCYRSATQARATIELCASVALAASGVQAAVVATTSEVMAVNFWCVLILGATPIAAATPRAPWLHAASAFVATSIVVSVLALGCPSLGASQFLLGDLVVITVAQTVSLLTVALIFVSPPSNV